jgi:hypothetical protein
MKKERTILPISYKAFAKEVTIEAGSRKVSGYFAAFNNKDEDGDVLLPGCFAKSIAEHGPESTSPRKVAFLWQHDSKEPIGKVTMLKEDAFGLYFEAEIDEVPRGEQALKQYQSGTLNNHSIGFRYIWDKMKFDDDQEAFLIAEVMLFEGSVVTMGANENTPFTGMKSADLVTENEKLVTETEQLCKSMTPETGQQIRSLFTKWYALAKTEQPCSKKCTAGHKDEPPKPDVEQIDLEKVKSLLINQF